MGQILARTANNAKIAYLTNQSKFYVNTTLIRTGGIISRTVRVTRTGNVYANGVNLQAEWQVDGADVTGTIPEAYFVRYTGMAVASDAFAVKSTRSRLSSVCRLRASTSDNWTSTSAQDDTDAWFIINLTTGETVDCISSGNGFYNGYFSPYCYYTSSLTTY